jgi:hypothetical protein
MNIESRAALDAIARLTTHTDACDIGNHYRPICDHDRADSALRDLLIDPDIDPNAADYSLLPDNPYATDDATITRLRDAITILDADPYAREELTALLLSQSLCPLHRIDYAICFDDEDPECAAIRTIHPSHDT